MPLIVAFLLCLLTALANASTVTSNVHNAPGWISGTSYAVPAAGFPPLRVNNGAAWNGTVYTPGSRLDDFQLVTAGGGTSTTGPTNSNCAVTCTLADGYSWKYVSGVDYITLTGFFYDAPSCASLFGAGVVYWGDLCTNDSPLRAYWLKDLTTSSGETCSIPPTGTGGTITPGDGCTWSFIMPVTYSSRASYIPVKRYVNGCDPSVAPHCANCPAPGPTTAFCPVAQIVNPPVALLYNDATYDTVADTGTTSAITPRQHQDYTDWTVCSEDGFANQNFTLLITVQAAPGEGFADYSGGVPTLGSPNQKYGVLISSTTAGGVNPQDAAIYLHDNSTRWSGLQIKSLNGSAIGGENCHDNLEVADHNIMESDASGRLIFECDGGCSLYDNLMIGSGPGGVFFKYPGWVTYNTIINKGAVADSVAVSVSQVHNLGPDTLRDNALFGWVHSIANNNTTVWDANSDYNATSVASPDPGVGTVVNPGGLSDVTITVHNMPGAHSQFSLSASSQFVNSASDWRLKAGSVLIAAGAVVGTIPGDTGSYQPDTPDVVGTTRPQGGTYDIGSWQTPGATPPTITGPGRMMLR